MRRTLPVLALALVLGLGVYLHGCGAGPGGPAIRGQALPEFELAELGGGTLQTDDLRRKNQPVILNFWATWCGPCIREIPALQELHRSGEVQVVSVSLDKGGKSVVAPFVRDQQIDYPVLLGNMSFFQRLGGSAIPYTLILDPDLRIIAVHRGLVSKNTLDKGIAKARKSASS